MRTKLLQSFVFIGFFSIFGVTLPSAVSAADLDLQRSAGVAAPHCAEIVFSCANGREYALCPIAVSVAGDIVTGRLYSGGHSAAYVRLVPMGVGYRYAGKGIWLDGLHGNAQLNFEHRRPIACTAVRS